VDRHLSEVVRRPFDGVLQEFVRGKSHPGGQIAIFQKILGESLHEVPQRGQHVCPRYEGHVDGRSPRFFDVGGRGKVTHDRSHGRANIGLNPSHQREMVDGISSYDVRRAALFEEP
jgi:hypothetical protein